MTKIDSTSDLLERLLDVATRRQALVAANVANVDTPGYVTRDLDFNRAMEEADAQSASFDIERTSPGHLGGDDRLPELALFEFEPEGLPRRNDLNNVSMDRELMNLAATAGKYSTAVELLRKRFALLRYALTDGRNGAV